MLSELEARLGCNWLSIHKAISETETKISYLQTALTSESKQFLSPGASFVCFGSLARAEWTCHSDLDWIMLVRDGTEEQHAISLQSLSTRLNKTKEIGPATGGMFGSTISIENLTASIRRQASVKDLSVRLLLLLESIAVGDDERQKEAIREILTAYLTDSNPHPDHAETISDVLLNDIAVFGKIMAVNLEHESEEQSGPKWGLRNAKRRFSRRLIVATGSLACLRWRQHCAAFSTNGRTTAHYAIEYFKRYLARPPLEILAAEVIQAGVPDSIARKAFGAYDQFLAILDDADSREQLARLPQHLAGASDLFRRVRGIGQEFWGDLHKSLNLTSVAPVNWHHSFSGGGDMNASNNRQALGANHESNAGMVLIRIVSLHPEIGQVFFGAPRVNPSLRDRVGYPGPEWTFVEQALKRYPDLPLPARVRCLLSISEMPEGILEAMSYHQGIAATRFSVKVEELTPERVEELVERAAPNSLFSVCSQVQLKNGSTKHIPMMDFLCPKSERSLEVVRRVAPLFGAGGGFILESDRSYHFYGSRLLSEWELVRFLARALLFAPVVDQTWIAHQLIDKCCALRIRPHKGAGAAPPLVYNVDQR
jgi:hypothetical protein